MFGYRPLSHYVRLARDVTIHNPHDVRSYDLDFTLLFGSAIIFYIFDATIRRASEI